MGWVVGTVWSMVSNPKDARSHLKSLDSHNRLKGRDKYDHIILPPHVTFLRERPPALWKISAGVCRGQEGEGCCVDWVIRPPAEVVPAS